VANTESEVQPEVPAPDKQSDEPAVAHSAQPAPVAGTASTPAAFAAELRTRLEEWPDAYRSKKTGEVMSAAIIEELVRSRYDKIRKK
jgi:hypothetical protein